MKGKGSYYYALPNLGRLRTRLESPEKTLTSEIRSEFQKICVKVLNKSSLEIRAGMIDYIKSRTDLKFKTPEHKKQVENLFSGIFDSCFAVDQDSLNALVGADADDESAADDAQVDEAPAETPNEAPAESKAKKAKSGKAPVKDEEFD